MKNFTQFTYHLQFEPEYDQLPVIRVYENYLDFDGELHTDFEQIVDRYEFTVEDVDFTLAIFGYEDIAELWIDQYYRVEEFARQKWIHPVVTKWVEDHYEEWVAAHIKEVTA